MISERGLDYFLGHLDAFRMKYDRVDEGDATTQKGYTLTNVVKERMENDLWDAEFMLRNIARTASKLVEDMEKARAHG